MSAHRVLSVLERAKMVCWFEETNSLAMVARRYRAEFGVEPPTLAQIKKIHRHFLQTGSVIGSQAEANVLTAPYLGSSKLNSVEAQNLSLQQAMQGPKFERFA